MVKKWNSLISVDQAVFFSENLIAKTTPIYTSCMYVLKIYVEKMNEEDSKIYAELENEIKAAAEKMDGIYSELYERV